MFVVTVEFEVKKNHVAAFRKAVLEQAQNSLSREADCHRFDVCFDPMNDTRLFLYEIYTDEPAFERHMQSDHFHEFGARVEDWLISKSVQTWVGQEQTPEDKSLP